MLTLQSYLQDALPKYILRNRMESWGSIGTPTTQVHDFSQRFFGLFSLVTLIPNITAQLLLGLMSKRGSRGLEIVLDVMMK